MFGEKIFEKYTQINMHLNPDLACLCVRLSVHVHVCLCPYLCSPSSVDEGADGLVGPCATGVQVCAIPGFDQTHKVCTLPLIRTEGTELQSIRLTYCAYLLYYNNNSICVALFIH